MTTLIVDDKLASQLQEIADDENRPVEDILRSLLELYAALPKNITPGAQRTRDEMLAAMDGMFDDDVTDLSTTVRGTMAAYYQKKYGNPD
jgi:hypothetical protein